MVKLRLTSVDSKAAIDEIRAQAVGMRLVNVYDLSPRVYLLKFGQGERKVYVLFESGVRLHITNYSREKPKVPSQFTLKLRKHVRSWRLDSVTQLGTDRVVDMQFGGGDNSFHFIMELYGQGNFALTDHNYSIMMLLRSAKSEDVRLAVRETYPIGNAKQFQPRTRDEIVQALETAGPSDTLRACLPLNFYGTLLGDHMLASCGLNPGEKKRVWADDVQSIADSVFDVCRTVDDMLGKDMSADGGLLIQFKPPSTQKQVKTTAPSQPSPQQQQTSEPSADDAPAPDSLGARQASTSSSDLVGVVENADEFWPACVESLLDRSRLLKMERTKTFSEAADRCFRVTEQDKINTHNEKRDQVVLSKKEKFMRDHQRRIDSLTAEQQKNEQYADLILANVEEVDAAINLVNGVLATGMSWDSLSSLIRHRQAEGRFPVANIIHNLKLHKNQISLLLTQDCGADDDCEDADLEPVVVDVDIGMNAYSNAAQYHSVKKAVKAKLSKTIGATDKAAAAAEQHGKKLAKKVTEKRDITQFRTPLWFEKFHWFLTSHGYIVVAGRDPAQADVLFRRYVSQYDVWIHGDAPGCLPFVLKNPSEHERVPLSSIEEAGIMCIARTESWRKAPVSAWWCVAAQVSNKTPQGDHLHRGTFFVRGQKNYMPAMQLQLAVALLFRTDARRAPRETAGVPVANVREALDQLQQQLLHQQQQPASASAPAQHNTSAGSEGDEDRQTSGDLTEGTGANSPTGAVKTFPACSPTSMASSSSGAKKTVFKNLMKRGHGGSHAGAKKEGSGNDSDTTATITTAASEVQTMSITSTRTGASKGIGGSLTGGSPAAGTAAPLPTPHDIITNQNLSSRQLSKIRKIKKKYSEQDDQDRQRAMELLGNGVAKVHQVLIQAEAMKQQDDGGEDSGEAGGSNNGGDGVEQEEEDDDPTSRHLASSTGRVRFAEGEDEYDEADDGSQMEREHEAMNRRASSFEDDTARMLERMAEESVSVVPFLDGAPVLVEGTEVHEIIVVCAPYAAVRHYTFKARIAPGQEKKGLAAQDILHGFTKALEPIVPQALKALKAVSADSIIAQLPGLVKIHMQDMSAVVSNASAQTGAVCASSSQAAESIPAVSSSLPCAAASSSTADQQQQQSSAAPKPSDNPNLSVRQRQKLKKEELEKELMDKLRAERKMRQVQRESQHADPACA